MKKSEDTPPVEKVWDSSSDSPFKPLKRNYSKRRPGGTWERQLRAQILEVLREHGPKSIPGVVAHLVDQTTGPNNARVPTSREVSWSLNQMAKQGSVVRTDTNADFSRSGPTYKATQHNTESAQAAIAAEVPIPEILIAMPKPPAGITTADLSIREDEEE